MRLAASLFVVAALATAGRASAQRAPDRSAPLGASGGQPKYVGLFHSDSMEFWAPDLSPDGRWIVCSGPADSHGSSNLWILPTAGGMPIRLTSGPHQDMWPRWFPSGDRVAFFSNRPVSTTGELFVMSIGVDPRTGRPKGPPQQVTLDPAQLGLAISPDGNWIAYRAPAEDSVIRIKVLPATGGTARTVASFPETPGAWPFVEWSADGRWISYATWNAARSMEHVRRVSVSGGALQTIAIVGPGVGVHDVDPTGKLLLLTVPFLHRLRIVTAEGRTVADFSTQGLVGWVWRFTSDGRGLIAQRANDLSVTRVVPLAGGPVRLVGDTTADYTDVFGWSPDGSRVFTLTSPDAAHGVAPVVVEAPVNGGPSRHWMLPAGASHVTVARDGRHFWYYLPSADGTAYRLMAGTLGRSEASPASPWIVASPATATWPAPPGGDADPDSLPFLQRRGGAVEVGVAAVDGQSRLLWTFRNGPPEGGIGVHGTRIAYVEHHSDSTTLFVAQGAAAKPHAVLTLPGRIVSPIWSHDGTRIAADYYPSDTALYRVLVVAVRPDGSAASSPQIVTVAKGWDQSLYWLPDDGGVTVGLDPAGEGIATVWLVPLQDGTQPAPITPADGSRFWDYQLSPDGRHVAYTLDIPRGSSIWKLDLGDLLKGSRPSPR